MKSIHDPRQRQLVEKLITLREQCGVTQTTLAALLNRNQSYVAKVENFDRRLDVIEIADWVRALGARPNSFMDDLEWWL